VLGPALLSGSLPTVTASWVPAPGHRVSDGQVQETLAVLGAAPAPLARFVVRAYPGPTGLTVVMRSGLNAYFGDAGRPHAKWLALALVLANERSAGATYVDVRVPSRPAAGFLPGSGPPAAQGSGSSPTTSSGEGAATTEATAAALAAAVGREQGEHGGQAQTPSTSEPSSEQSRSGAPGEARSGSATTRAGAAAEAPEGTARTGP